MATSDWTRRLKDSRLKPSIRALLVPIEVLVLIYLLAKRRLKTWGEVRLARDLPIAGEASQAPPSVDIVLSRARLEPRAFGLVADAGIFRDALPGSRIVDGYGDIHALRSNWRLFIEEVPRRASLIDPRRFHALMVNIENSMHNLGVIRRMNLVLCKNRYTYDLLSRYRDASQRYRHFQLEITAGEALIHEGNQRVSEFDDIRGLLQWAGPDPAALGFELELTRFTSRRILADEEVAGLIENGPYDRIVHFASSPHKNTRAIIEAYLAFPSLPDLLIVSSISDILEARLGGRVWRSLIAGEVPNLRIEEGPVSTEDQRRLFRSHRVHLCPSSAEGFGHYINEARGAGCLVITTAAPPMNELIDPDSGLLVPVSRRFRNGSFGAEAVEFELEALARTLEEAVGLSPDEKRRRARNARLAFEEDSAFFFRAMSDLHRRFTES